MTPPFDAVLVLGKELRLDRERAIRELRARAAAAAAAWRVGAAFVATLEASLRGQDRSGSALVREMLHDLGVPDEAVVARSLTRSTREEAVMGTALFAERAVRRGLVLTAAYHVPRARRLFGDSLCPAEVHTPEAMWRAANPREREWIAEGSWRARSAPLEPVLEGALGALEWALSPLPVGLRARIEVRAGSWWRGAR